MIPFDNTSSCGVLLCDWVNEWVATINRTPGTGPTFSSRWHFVFAMLVWNNYQAISEKARYLDGFPSPSVRNRPFWLTRIVIAPLALPSLAPRNAEEAREGVGG